MTLDTAVLADLERKHVPFACSCGGRRWVEDENWTPDDPRHAERTKHDGLIPCGSCNLGGWATPENAASEPWCAEDNQDWPCDAAALLAEVESLRKALQRLDAVARVSVLTPTGEAALQAALDQSYWLLHPDQRPSVIDVAARADAERRAGSAVGATLGNRPDVAKSRVAKATRGAKGAKP